LQGQVDEKQNHSYFHTTYSSGQLSGVFLPSSEKDLSHPSLTSQIDGLSLEIRLVCYVTLMIRVCVPFDKSVEVDTLAELDAFRFQSQSISTELVRDSQSSIPRPTRLPSIMHTSTMNTPAQCVC
jgi:hypothetical protein